MSEVCTTPIAPSDPAYLHGAMTVLMRFQPAPVAPQAAEPAALAATVPTTRSARRSGSLRTAR